MIQVLLTVDAEAVVVAAETELALLTAEPVAWRFTVITIAKKGETVLHYTG